LAPTPRLRCIPLPEEHNPLERKSSLHHRGSRIIRHARRGKFHHQSAVGWKNHNVPSERLERRRLRLSCTRGSETKSQALRISLRPTPGRSTDHWIEGRLAPRTLNPHTRITQKAPSAWDGASVLCRRSPNLPHTFACSTIGPVRLNFRVRDGNGCDPHGKLTGKIVKSRSWRSLMTE
jgi:hypothetical protein